MFNANLFAKNLTTLIEDSEKTVEKIAEEVQVENSTLYRYLNLERTPEVKILLILANYFKCSLAFLLGQEFTYYEYNANSCPPFSKQFQKFLKTKNTNVFAVSKATKIPNTTLYHWSQGANAPTVDGIMILANYFNVSVDDFLGR